MKGYSSMATLITPESGTDWEHVDLFLAGGISNCPDWQSEVIRILENSDLHIANPRRPYGLEKTGDAAAKQIALLELGRKMTEDRPLVVGVDEYYERRFDVEQQLWLEREEKPLYDLAEAAKTAAEKCNQVRMQAN